MGRKGGIGDGVGVGLIPVPATRATQIDDARRTDDDRAVIDGSRGRIGQQGIIGECKRIVRDHSI